MSSEQFRQYVDEMEKLHQMGWLFQITLDPGALSALVAQASLALRHPKNTGPSASIAYESITKIIEAIEPEAPEMARVMRDGLTREAQVKA